MNMKTDYIKNHTEDTPRNPYLKNYNVKMFQTYQKGAEQGNASDITNLGICYQKGKGTEKNHLKEEAETLNRKLTELTEEELAQVSGGLIKLGIELPGIEATTPHF